MKSPLNIPSDQITKREDTPKETIIFTSIENEFEKIFTLKNAVNIIIERIPLLMKTLIIHLLYSFNYRFNYFFFTNYDT